MSQGFAGKACVMTGAGPGAWASPSRARSAPRVARSPPSTPSPSRSEFAAGEGGAGRYLQGDATDEALVARTGR